MELPSAILKHGGGQTGESGQVIAIDKSNHCALLGGERDELEQFV